MQWIATAIDGLELAEGQLEAGFENLAADTLTRVTALADVTRPADPTLATAVFGQAEHVQRAIQVAGRDGLAPIRRERAWLQRLLQLSNPPRPRRAPAPTSPTTASTAEVESYADADAFRVAAEPVITADPVATTRIASMIAASRGRAAAGEEFGFVVRTTEGVAVSVAMVPTTRTLDVVAMPPGAIPQLVAAVAAEGIELRGVRGNVVAAEAFATAWCARTGQRWSPSAHKCLHRLDTLTVPTAPGALQAAVGPADAAIVHRWSRAFGAEAVAGDAPPSLAAVVGKLESNLAWLWRDESGAPVSYVGASPAAYGVQRIGPVYTPPEHRGHGYASAATAEVAAELRTRPGVDTVCLFTDLANETSNRIYRAIGFEPVHGSIELTFD